MTLFIKLMISELLMISFFICLKGEDVPQPFGSIFLVGVSCLPLLLP